MTTINRGEDDSMAIDLSFLEHRRYEEICTLAVITNFWIIKYIF